MKEEIWNLDWDLADILTNHNTAFHRSCFDPDLNYQKDY